MLLKMLMALLASSFVFLIQLRFFHTRPVKKDRGKPTSFFDLEELASAKRLRALTYLYALPFTVFFFVIAVAIDPKSLSGGTSFVEGHVHHVWEHVKLHYAPEKVLDQASYLTPLFILFGALILFVPGHAPMKLFREVVLSTIGLEQRVEFSARKAAQEIISQIGYDEAVKTLEATYECSAPLPEELVEASKETRLAYRLLYFAQKEVANSGFEEAWTNLLRRFGIEPPADFNPVLQAKADPIYLTAQPLIAALAFYFVLCVFYILLVPFAGSWVLNSVLILLFAPIEWVNDLKWLAWEIVQQTLAFVVPLAGGMYLYAARRAQKHLTETSARTLAIVGGIQFISSFIISFGFYALYIWTRRDDDLSILGMVLREQDLSFGDAKVWAELTIAAMAPGAALIAWKRFSKVQIRGVDFLAACVAAATLFLLSRLSYEFISGAHRGFYWHQMLLGGFLTIAYYLAAQCARDVLLPPSEPGKSLLPVGETTSPAEIEAARI